MYSKITTRYFVIVAVFLFLSKYALARKEPNVVNIATKNSTKIPPAHQEKMKYQKTPPLKGYTYNIKRLLEKIKENIKKVDEKIREAEIEKRNEKREAEMRKHFERGNTLYKEGRFKEAKQEWQKVLEMSQDPEMKDYIQKAEKRAKEEEASRKKEEKERQKRLAAERKKKQRRLNKQAQVFYEQAVALYDSRNYKQAQVKFEQVANLVPHYARTEYYLKRISQDMQQEKKLQLKKQAESRYQKAVLLYRAGKHIEALAKFREVKRILPGYKATDYYLKRIPQDMRRRKEHELRKLKLAEEKKLKEKRKKLSEERRKQELTKKREFEKLVDSHYQKALFYYKSGNFDLAVKEFRKVLQLNPNHRLSQYYINNKIPAGIKLRQRIEEMQIRRKKRELLRMIEQQLRKFEQERKHEEEKRRKIRLSLNKYQKLAKVARLKKRMKRQSVPREIIKQQKEKKREKKKRLINNKAIQKARALFRDNAESTNVKLEDLHYKTKKECLDALGRDFDNREIFDNLVNLYLLIERLSSRADKLYRDKCYDAAIQMYNRILSIDYKNKKAKIGIKRARSRIK